MRIVDRPISTFLPQMKHADRVIERDHRDTDIGRAESFDVLAVERRLLRSYCRAATLESETVGWTYEILRRSFGSPGGGAISVDAAGSEFAVRW